MAQTEKKYNKLTTEEERVILHKGTERAFTGVYTDNKGTGTYVCKRCDTPLYRSTDKFDSQCGWPSFDDEIAGAVRKVRDADGKRTEIICTNCGAHLGHVFTGEGFTDKNTRHCVNSISLKFIPAPTAKTDTAYFASGCFWGTEYHFQKTKGVISTTVGYMGGQKANPTYKEVSTGATGHAETTQVIFNPELISYEELMKLFFETHDFTQVNRQGPDIGTQYRSVIFYTDKAQEATARQYKQLLGVKEYKVATEIVPATAFWKAENYHQDYYKNKGGSPYCHVYRKIF